MPELAVGARFAGYRIEALAGRGGMGIVYRATQLGLDRPVALKLLSHEFADDVEFRRRFARESRMAAAIEHPNVVPVYEAGETDEGLFIAMRWIDGVDLQKLIAAERVLEPERALAIVTQVAAALDASHRLGLVHRDVKPANVLVQESLDQEAGEHAYLTDFGLVKQSASDTALTKPGQFLGTVHYVAPEQIEGRETDARTDVYALGCVLFHALTGAVPYPRDSEVATLYAHMNDPPPLASASDPRLPRRLDAVLERALAKDPGDRPPSAGDFGRAAVAAIRGDAPPADERVVGTGDAAPVETRLLPTTEERPPPEPELAEAEADADTRPAGGAPSGRRLLLEGVAIAAAAAQVGYRVGAGIAPAGDSSDWGDVGGTALRRGLAWAAVAAALAVWASWRARAARGLISPALKGLAAGASAGALGAVAAAIPELYNNNPDALGQVAKSLVKGYESVVHDDQLDPASLAITGALLGAFLGALWRPRLILASLAVGALAAGVLELLRGSHLKGDWLVSLQAAVIAAAALGILLALRRPTSTGEPAVAGGR